jgi:hypothetical protein
MRALKYSRQIHRREMHEKELQRWMRDTQFRDSVKPTTKM